MNGKKQSYRKNRRESSENGRSLRPDRGRVYAGRERIARSQPAPDTEPAAGKAAEPTPSVPEAPDTTPGLRPDSASDDESGTADRQTDDTPATAGEDERPLSAVTAFADTPEELAARQATEAAARESADRATTESGVGSRLKAEAGRILAAYPDAPVVYMTSNGFGFFRESEARNHAATLRDKAVITVKRK